MPSTTTESPATAAAAPVERVWIYCGERLEASNKLYHLWQDHEGQPRHYDKVVGRSVGSRYRVYQPADRPDNVYSKGRYEPMFLGRADDVEHAQLAAWEVEHRAARTRKQMLAAEKKEAAMTELRTALQPIRDRYRKTISSRERAAILALAIQEITG